MKRSSDLNLLLGAGALAVGLLVAGSFLARGWTTQQPHRPLPTGEPATVAPAGPEVALPDRADAADAPDASGPAEGADPVDPAEALLRLAADRAPFDPARQRAPERYRLPDGAAPQPPAAPTPEPAPTPPFRLLGTIADPNGGGAVVAVEGSGAHVMSLGEELFGYRLARIGAGSVTMTGDGRSLTLSVPGPMATGQGAEGTAAAARSGQEVFEAVRARGEDPVWRQEQFVRQLEQLRALQDRGMGQLEVLEDRIIFTGEGGTWRELPFPPGASVIRQGDGMQMQLRQPPGGDR